MENETENADVIQQEMQETRASLVEKLETLEQKVAGVVGTVEQVTSSVSETVESIKDTVSETTNTVNAVSESFQEGVKTVQESAASVTKKLDFSNYMEDYPWFVVAGSLAAGFFLGNFMNRKPQSAAPMYYQPPAPPVSAGNYGNGNQDRRRNGSNGNTAVSSSSTSVAPAVESVWSQEIDKLKGLALGALFGTARELISASLPPAMGQQVKDLIDDVTKKAGGAPLPAETFAFMNQKSAVTDKEEDAAHDHGRQSWSGIGPTSH